MHHNKQEPECKNEKHSLIKLVSQYKTIITNIINNNSNYINKEKLKELQEDYEIFSTKLYDTEYFNSLCGQTFGDAVDP
jgi:hypothetical protein